MEQDVPSDIEYCPACKCMIERWWNYCAICGFHTATNDQQRNETAADRVAEQPLSRLLWKIIRPNCTKTESGRTRA
jgi:hypothetical protein